jgi:integrase
LSAGGLQVAVENATRERFGQHVNVHLFRDCAATSLADEHPDHMKVAADLLGHRSFATTQKYYIASGQRRALRTVQDGILQHRKGRRPSRRGTPHPVSFCHEPSSPWRRR